MNCGEAGIRFYSLRNIDGTAGGNGEKVREENYEPTYGALEYEDKMYGIPLEYNIEYGGSL